MNVDLNIWALSKSFEGLPVGVQLSPGRIVNEGFSTAEDALQRPLELGMAIGNDMAGVEDRVAKRWRQAESLAL